MHRDESISVLLIYDVGEGPKVSQTATDVKFFEGRLDETTSQLLTVSGLPPCWMFETSRLPCYSDGGEALTGEQNQHGVV